MIKFSEIEGHCYRSINPNDNRKWTSVTSLISELKGKFDAVAVSEYVSAKKDSKWYGISPADIMAIWDAENKRAVDLGKWYHWMKERGEDQLNICKEQDGWKYASPQVLTEGVYPEFMLYLDEYKICGQADRIEVIGNKFNISDYKTSKTIDTVSFGGKRMLCPLNNLQDCSLSHYTIQLSLYAYMVKQHNPHLILDKLEIQHIRFDVAKLDKFGYPIVTRDKNGDYIVKKVTPIKVPYLEYEVENLLKWIKKKHLQAV